MTGAVLTHVVVSGLATGCIYALMALSLVIIYNERVTIEIADTGPGIPAEIQARVFEPFFTTKFEGQGTGLGLALTRGIVDGHGGAIRVTSRPGEGATFHIELPVGAPRRPAANAAQEPDPAVRGRQILIVDDEPAVAAILSEALTTDQHVVETAENGAVALEKLASARTIS
jgi:CheY-like chemotaxis protein